MTSASSNHHDEPLSLKRIMNESRENKELLQLLAGTLPLMARAVFAVVELLAGAAAGMVSPFLRRRPGLLAVMLHGPLSLTLLAWVGSAVHGWEVLGVVAWTLALAATLGVQFVLAVVRLYLPRRHVHRWSLGEPRRPVVAILRWAIEKARPLRGFLTHFGEAALVGASVFPFAAVTIALSLLGFRVGVGLGAVAALASLGLVIQGASQKTRWAWRMQILRDREKEQEDLGRALAEGGPAGSLRELEGFASIN